MSAEGEQRVRRIGRSYTRARRHPWVQGKIGEFTLPLGPYTMPQLVIAAVGTLVLIKTYGLWAPLGPVPLFGLGALVWAARRAKIGGRTPTAALLGLLVAALEPPAGRINGATARDRRPSAVYGGFHFTATVPPRAAVAAPVECLSARDVRAGGPPAPALARPWQPGPGAALTPLQRLLAQKSVGG